MGFSHPADYTPVCTTELGRVQMLSNDFAKRGVKLIALSCDEVDSHNGWIKDIIAYNNLSTGFSYPIIADPKREVATLYGMMDPDEKDAQGIPLTCRAVFIIGPDKRLKLSLLYPATSSLPPARWPRLLTGRLVGAAWWFLELSRRI